MHRIVIQPRLFTAIVALLFAAPAARAANELYLPAPDPDPFYAQPDPMPDLPPGTILDSREITFTPLPHVSMTQFPAWHLKFVSTNALGNRVAATATVVTRAKEAATSPRPLLAYQIAYNSLGTLCHPSHSHAGGSDDPNHGRQFPAFAKPLIDDGWAILLPDHEGPLVAYAEPIGAAHLTLDAVRAAERFAPLGLAGAGTPVAFWGFSGGSPATVWASILRPQYAPELNVVAMVSGGTTVHTESVFRAIDEDPAGNRSYFRYGLTAAIGLARVYPGFFPVGNLNAAGIAAAEGLRDGCDAQTTDGSPRPTGRFADYTVVEDPLGTAGAQAVYAAISLPQAGLAPAAPTYVYHAAGDEVAPVAEIDALVDGWCTEGTNVAYNRFPEGNHLASAPLGGPDAVRFLESRVEGTDFVPLPTTTTCN